LYLDAERQKISASEHPLSSLAQDIPSTIPPTRRHVLWRERWIWGVTAFLLVAIGFTSLEWFPSLSHERTAKGTPASGAPGGISVNGSTVFDTNRPDGALKLQAAKQVSANNMAGAQILWQQALALESNDAEVQIYQENQVVMLSHHPYMTLVVGVIFSQQHVGGARDILQGAYVKQKEYNNVMLKQPQGILLRLMIASADVDSLSPQMVAQKIVQAAQQDPTIVGVVGWSTSASTESALPVLTAAHIPLISPTASSDNLSGKSPYFFRVAPTDQQQAIVAAQYVSDTLHAKHVALFVDSNDSYSNSLASAFKGALQGTDGKVVTNTYTYVKGDPNTIDVQMNTVLQQQPDLIYFAGYVDDVSVVLSHLTACQNHQQCLLVMGGDALYVQGNYSLQDFKNYDHLLFTSFAFQPQDQIRHPQFFTDYARFFDPKGLYRAGTYGYNATDADAILSYDATSVFVQAREQLATQQRTSHLTIQAMQQVLHTLHVDGVSGSISFDQDGNPVHKGVVILKGSANGKTVLASQN
jgi:ABC-type branched-subunit amino acid transport system substrate-binding protein